MLVIAFDGILFDTLEFRATALVDAFAREGIDAEKQTVLSILPSRSLAEAVRAVAHAHAHAHADADAIDETTLDLVALRAERSIGEWGSRGAILNTAVCDRLRRAAAVTRIVVRADSRRRTVDQLLALTDLESAVSLIRCSDDIDTTHSAIAEESHARAPSAPAQPGREPTLISLERSYAHIVRRMYANRSLLGGTTNIGVAVEVGAAGRAIAHACGFDTPENFSAAQVPGF